MYQCVCMLLTQLLPAQFVRIVLCKCWKLHWKRPRTQRICSLVGPHLALGIVGVWRSYKLTRAANYEPTDSVVIVTGRSPCCMIRHRKKTTPIVKVESARVATVGRQASPKCLFVSYNYLRRWTCHTFTSTGMVLHVLLCRVLRFLGTPLPVAWMPADARGTIRANPFWLTLCFSMVQHGSACPV